MSVCNLGTSPFSFEYFGTLSKTQRDRFLILSLVLKKFYFFRLAYLQVAQNTCKFKILIMKSSCCEGFWVDEKFNESHRKCRSKIEYVPWGPGGKSKPMGHDLRTIRMTLKKSKKSRPTNHFWDKLIRILHVFWATWRYASRKNKFFSKLRTISKICPVES